MSASRAAATIAVTHTVEAKKKKRKRTKPIVSGDTTTVSSGVETIDVGNEEDDTKSLSATTTLFVGMPRRVASPEGRETETPHMTSMMEELPTLGANALGDIGSEKRAKKAPPKPCKPGLRSATK
jgi:hypothetical protein